MASSTQPGSLGRIQFAASGAGATVLSQYYFPREGATTVHLFVSADQNGTFEYLLFDSDDDTRFSLGAPVAISAGVLDPVEIDLIVVGLFAVQVRFINTSGIAGLVRFKVSDNGEEDA